MIAAGRLKPGPEKTIAEDYLTRAQGWGRKCGISRIAVTEFNESQASSPAARMAEEARLIAGALAAKSFTVVLDERGKALPSEAFADLLRRHLDGGTADMAFLIGGPDGLGGLRDLGRGFRRRRGLRGFGGFCGFFQGFGRLGHWATCLISNGTGCCAAWGCSGPA